MVFWLIQLKTVGVDLSNFRSLREKQKTCNTVTWTNIDATRLKVVEGFLKLSCFLQPLAYSLTALGDTSDLRPTEVCGPFGSQEFHHATLYPGADWEGYTVALVNTDHFRFCRKLKGLEKPLENDDFGNNYTEWYCWWKKSRTTTWDVFQTL